MRGFVLSFFFCFSLAGLAATVPSQPVNWVDPRIGTAAAGQTFPATGVPFGMTQWTPETRAGEIKCVAPYYDADTELEGFRGSHFMSGSCTQDYGSVTLMPLSGTLRLGTADRASPFSHSTETMTPYRYAVTLSRYGIRAELTGTARSGILRFRFNRGGRSWVLVQSNARNGEGTVHINPEKEEVTLVNPVHLLYAGTGKLAGFSGYSVVTFNRPFQVGGTWSGAMQHDRSLDQKGGEGDPGAYISFDLKPGETVEVRVGTSFTSLEEARSNLEAEIPNWNFEQVSDHARAAWNATLGRVQVEGTPAKLHIFYTALYHSFLLPRIFSDADGSYPSFAGGERLETARGFTYYDDFSLWDTFRAVHPLFTILDPKRDGDMVRSLIEKGEQGGFLPIYPAWNSYTSEMIGDHADAVIADAYFKGIRGFDIEKAYQLMRKNATELPASHVFYLDGQGRRGLESYLKYGYIPLEDHVPDAFHKNEQVSRTLEYAYDDFLVGEVAHALGKAEDAALFEKRAENYRNVIDPSLGFARGRHEDGSWSTPFNPALSYPYVTESTPYEYTFFVPQDIPGLIRWIGGQNAFIDRLNALFAKKYYEHGNEPSHQIAYLYDYAGAAWKTQEHVHQILETKYLDRPDGLAGNDDCGQMSAWYVLSSLGFYPVTPGVPRYAIGAPQFDDVTLMLPGGKKLHIRAAGALEGKFFIRSARLNGLPLAHPWIEHSQITSGGDLVFEMSSTPTLNWTVSNSFKKVYDLLLYGLP